MIDEILTAYCQRVREAPLLSEAELHRRAFELLKRHGSMLDACMVGEQERLRGDPGNPGDCVGKAVQEIREAVFEIGVLAHKRAISEIGRSTGRRVHGDSESIYARPLYVGDGRPAVRCAQDVSGKHEPTEDPE